MGECPAARPVQITIAKQTNFVQAFARELLAKDTSATRALTGRAIRTSTVQVPVWAQATVLVARPKRYVEGASICRARAPPRLVVAKDVQVDNTKTVPAIGLHRASPRKPAKRGSTFLELAPQRLAVVKGVRAESTWILPTTGPQPANSNQRAPQDTTSAGRRPPPKAHVLNAGPTRTKAKEAATVKRAA